MTKIELMTRTGAAAIAAALALSPTAAFAQDAGTEVAPPVTAEEPVTETAPAAEPPATELDELAPVEEPAPAAGTEASETAPAPASARPKPAKSSAPSAARSAPRAEPAATAAMAPAVEALQPEAMPVAPAPIAVAEPVPQGEAGELPVDEEVAYGAGAAAMLALGIGAVALTRRRRRDDEEAWDEEPAPAMDDGARPADPEAYVPPVIAPPAIDVGTRSAFSWGNAGAFAATPTNKESHAERAMRGPTPENPSLSLRKRLKRAAFLDRREREVAEGIADPVSPTAGLPEAAVDQAPPPRSADRASERQLELA